jgi:hypothetical protein
MKGRAERVSKRGSIRIDKKDFLKETGVEKVVFSMLRRNYQNKRFLSNSYLKILTATSVLHSPNFLAWS